MIEATSGLKRFAIITAIAGFLLLPFIVALCTRSSLVIVTYGETVAVPRDINNATPLDFDLDEDPRIVVSIPKDDDVYLGRKKVTDRDAMRASINQRLKTAHLAEKIVYLRSGFDVTYGSVVDVLGTLRGTDMDRVGLIVRPRQRTGRQKGYGLLEVKLPLKY